MHLAKNSSGVLRPALRYVVHDPPRVERSHRRSRYATPIATPSATPPQRFHRWRGRRRRSSSALRLEAFGPGGTPRVSGTRCTAPLRVAPSARRLTRGTGM
eukprot:364759-Chlamydomonas_euryale.AAC.22